MLKKIRAYFSTKRKKETIAKLIEIKAGFYKANAQYTNNLNELYNVLYNTELTITDDLVLLRGVTIESMFTSSKEACEFVLDVVDKGDTYPHNAYLNKYIPIKQNYLDWRVNDFTLVELAKLYKLFIKLFYFHRANKDNLLSLDEVNIYNRLTFNQLDFFKSIHASRLRDEAINFYILLLQLELGSYHEE